MSNLNVSEINSDIYKISEQELQQGISISAETIAKIETNMQSILLRMETASIKLYKGQWKHRVFSIDTAPGLIFKMNDHSGSTSPFYDNSIQGRYRSMVRAQTVVRTHNLGLLVIPRAKLITVEFQGKKYDIIAEQKLDISHEASKQEQYYEEYAGSLSSAIRQFAIFICITGHSDIEWRNNPVLNNSLDNSGNRKIALIDLEITEKPERGLFGGIGKGLVSCVTEEQGKMIEAVAKQYRVNTASFAEASVLRKKELEDVRKLKEYYTKKRITLGNEPVQIDQKALDFSEYPEKSQELKSLALKVLATINEQIDNNGDQHSVKGRRYIYINTNKEPFHMTVMPIDRRRSELLKSDEERQDASYIGCVVKKLVESGAVYRLVNRNGHGYDIQA